MEWVETTGRSIEEAKEAALDELGVDETDAEFEILEEPRAGLFGRLRSEARVRARVRPTAPRSKDDRRDRRRRGRGSGAAETGPPAAVGTGDADVSGPDQSSARSGPGGSADSSETGGSPGRRRRSGRERPGSERTAAAGGGSTGALSEQSTPAAAGNTRPGRRRPESVDNEQREGADVEVALEEQAKMAKEFLQQLTGEIGLAAEITINHTDEESVELQMRGSDLGLLIGPKGSTLLAIQDLTRTVVHHQTGANNGRINVDVGGYRQKRTEALARFAVQVATTVKATGERTALEPMSAADRKVVHDTVNDIEGVATISEGEDPHRRVVIVPTEG